MPHMVPMISREHLAAICNTRLVQSLMFALGVLLLIAAPIISPLPGPGGLLLAAAGPTLGLRTRPRGTRRDARWRGRPRTAHRVLAPRLWAQRRSVLCKRGQPRAGSWFDWGLRRGSARRREA